MAMVAPEARESLTFWTWVILAATAFLVLVRLITMINTANDIDDGSSATNYVLYSLASLAFGGVLVAAGCLAGLPSMGPRVALIIGGGYFLLNPFGFGFLFDY